MTVHVSSESDEGIVSPETRVTGWLRAAMGGVGN